MTLRYIEDGMKQEREKFEARMKQMSDMLAAAKVLSASIPDKKRGIDEDGSDGSDPKRSKVSVTDNNPDEQEDEKRDEQRHDQRDKQQDEQRHDRRDDKHESGKGKEPGPNEFEPEILDVEEEGKCMFLYL